MPFFKHDELSPVRLGAGEGDAHQPGSQLRSQHYSSFRLSLPAPMLVGLAGGGGASASGLTGESTPE